jgi:hypothetical protein
VDVGSEATRRAHHWLCCCLSSYSPSAFFCTATTAAVKSLQEVVDIAVLSNELHGSLTAQLRACVLFVRLNEHHYSTVRDLLLWH